MSDLDSMISDALENGADYLAMGEIAAHTGLLVSQAKMSFDRPSMIKQAQSSTRETSK